MVNEAETLVKKITERIQEMKGKNIVIAGLTAINNTICSYFVICQGNSPSQVTAIVDSVKEYVPVSYTHLRPEQLSVQEFIELTNQVEAALKNKTDIVYSLSLIHIFRVYFKMHRNAELTIRIGHCLSLPTG